MSTLEDAQRSLSLVMQLIEWISLNLSQLCFHNQSSWHNVVLIRLQLDTSAQSNQCFQLLLRFACNLSLQKSSCNHSSHSIVSLLSSLATSWQLETNDNAASVKVIVSWMPVFASAWQYLQSHYRITGCTHVSIVFQRILGC